VSGIRRREFITLLGGAAAAWPLAAAVAQQPAMPVIGFLHQGSAQPYDQLGVNAFRRGLQESGYVEGRNVSLEFRWADGEYDRLPALAADLVRHQATVIAAALLPAARAAKAATATIPIVFISGSDPIETGLVTSLSRPTENVTGVSVFSVPLIAKRLQLLQKLIPGMSVVAALVNPRNPNIDSNVREIEAAARALGLRIEFIRASSDSDFDPAFATIVQQRADALVVSADAVFSSRREQLTALAGRHAVPTIYWLREFVAAGGLISYGTDFDMYRQAGAYVGRILKGARPVDLPVVQPTKFELVINLKNAKSLGLAIPPDMLALADEVIE
jgi:putative tryptophan/tyrosine transport system substrate-binding protein